MRIEADTLVSGKYRESAHQQRQWTDASFFFDLYAYRALLQLFVPYFPSISHLRLVVYSYSNRSNLLQSILPHKIDSLAVISCMIVISLPRCWHFQCCHLSLKMTITIYNYSSSLPSKFPVLARSRDSSLPFSQCWIMALYEVYKYDDIEHIEHLYILEVFDTIINQTYQSQHCQKDNARTESLMPLRPSLKNYFPTLAKHKVEKSSARQPLQLSILHAAIISKPATREAQPPQSEANHQVPLIHFSPTKQPHQACRDSLDLISTHTCIIKPQPQQAHPLQATSQQQAPFKYNRAILQIQIQFLNFAGPTNPNPLQLPPKAAACSTNPTTKSSKD